MELKTRHSSSNFIEITVDENQIIIFNSNKAEATTLIENLLMAVESLTSITGKSIEEHMKNIF